MRFGLAMALMGASLSAQSTPAGHWQGAIQTPNGDLVFEIDLAPDAEKGWIGAITIPAQKTQGLALIDVAVKDNTVAFGIKAPGDPRFKATFDKEGGKMSGGMTQGGFEMEFHLKRTGEAKVDKPVRNALLSKQLEGTWEGTLEVGENKLRLRFLLSNQGGAGTGAIFSLDQGNAEIPIAKITQKEALVNLEVPVVSGGFQGELKGAELTGEWSQGGRSLPLKLTRAAK
jgi:hypothetical protein